MKKQIKQTTKRKSIPEEKFCYKLYFKKNGCSILLFDKLLCHQALRRKRILKNMYNDWKGQFIVTK